MENGRVRYDRINAPFNLSIGSAELMQLNTFGGDDTLRTALDVPMNLDVNGGSGNDSLDGAGGNDRLDGGDGNDTMATRDGKADFVIGGAGTDTALVEALDAVAADVESVRPAAASRARAAAGRGRRQARPGRPRSRRASRHQAHLPGRHRGCNGSVSLFSTKTIKVGKLKAALDAGPQVLHDRRRPERRSRSSSLRAPPSSPRRRSWPSTARVVSRGAGEQARR